MRWLRLGLVSLLVVALGLAALELAFSRWLPLDSIIESWSADLGLRLRVGTARASLFPSPRLELENLAVEPDLQISRAVVRLQILDLLRGRFVGTRVRVIGPTVQLIRESDGSLSFALARSEEAFRDPPTAEPSASPSPPLSLANLPPLPPTQIRDGIIRYVDHTPASGVKETVLHLHTAALRVRGSDSAELRASASLDAKKRDTLQAELQLLRTPEGREELRVQIEMDEVDSTRVVPHLPRNWNIRDAGGPVSGDVRLTIRGESDIRGDLDLRLVRGFLDYAGIRADGDVGFAAVLRDDGELQIEKGRLRAESAVAGPVELTLVESEFRYAEHTVSFEPLRFEAWGGSLHVEGTLGVGDPPTFDLKVTASGITPRNLHDRVPLAALAEVTRLDAEGRVRGRWEGGESWLSPIEGSGQLSMHGGQVPSGGIIRTLVGVFPNRGASWKDITRNAKLATTELEALTTSFVLSGGRLRTPDLRVSTSDYVINADGWLDANNNDYDYDGTLAFTPSGFTRLLEVAGIRRRQGGGLPAVPFAVHGNLADDRFALRLNREPLMAAIVIPWAVNEVANQTSGALSTGADAARSAASWLGNLSAPKDEQAEER